MPRLERFASRWDRRSFRARFRGLWVRGIPGFWVSGYYYCMIISMLQYFLLLSPFFQSLRDKFYNRMFKKRNTKNNSINLSQIQQQQDPQRQQQVNGQPKKRVKLQKPEHTNTAIGGSTANRNNNAEELHRQFQTISYKKAKQNKQEQVLAGEAAAQLHETEEAKARYLKTIQITKKIKEGKLSTKIYRGQHNYANYKLSQEQLDNPLEHYKWKHGPTRSTTEKGAKNTCRFDYDPSRCKDWHDSGYCVFGNSCIYLHDRSDYKTGWELEKDFEKSERERWKRIINPGLDEEPEYIKDLEKYKPQENCPYCKQTLKNPVQVSCQHILCRKCVDKILAENSKCPECNKILNGIMNNAQKMLAKKKEQYAEMLKEGLKNLQMSKIKKNNYKDTNSLDVFNHQ